jgi:plasmid segregation protein ParM
LTLAAVARELNIRKLTAASVHLAAGLPLTWVSEQKESFRAYLLQNDSADFTFRGVDYHVEFAGADIFPQGFSAVADRLREFKGINMLCDIGNGTMNVMYINECRPSSQKCFTEKFGTYQCMLAVRENLMKQFGVSVDETVLDRVIRFGTADISERYLTAIRATAAEYAAGIFRRLREHEYDSELMRLFVVGGGGCIIKNFADYAQDRVIINDDICATAKGYELLAEQKLRKKGGVV